MANKRKRTLLHLRRADVVHALRTTIAAGIALEIAGLFELPEAYWAAMTTLIAMQSTLGAALTSSEHRFAGTALGAGMGALIATYFAPNVVWLAVDVFFLGIICSMVGLDKAAYRFAGVTLACHAGEPDETRVGECGSPFRRGLGWNRSWTDPPALWPGEEAAPSGGR
jgi:uncharacterized membrane protein YgaE (UPF0421/DUF939 family)